MKDLDKINVMAKSEIGFITVIVKPVWDLTNNYCNQQLNEQISILENNIQEWHHILEKHNKVSNFAILRRKLP